MNITGVRFREKCSWKRDFSLLLNLRRYLSQPGFRWLPEGISAEILQKRDHESFYLENSPSWANSTSISDERFIEHLGLSVKTRLAQAVPKLMKGFKPAIAEIL